MANLPDMIVNIPRAFNLENKSFYQLLEEMGYFETYDTVTIQALQDAFGKNPEFVEAWLEWSSNKRTSSGWYFERNPLGDYIVGYYPPRKQQKLETFVDGLLAAAIFVKNEIEAVRLAGS
jgi:hypothetical protein